MVTSRRVTLSTCALAAGAIVCALVPVAAGGAPAEAGAAPGCTATAHVDAQWSTGEIVTVTVTNTSTTAATRWTVSGTLPAGVQVVSAWNVTATASAGGLTAVNMPYNGALGAGASTTFGMQLSGTGPALALSCANDASSPPPDLTVGEADNGTTVTLFVGQTIRVSLPSTWRQTLPGGSVLATVSISGGYPTGQPVSAVYLAVGPGDFNLDTDNGVPCCGPPTQFWVVHVHVVDAPPADHTVTVTEASNTTTVSLHVGDVLAVSLPAIYVPPAVPGGVLAQRDVTGGYPTGQALIAHYTATAPGQVDVHTVSDIACNHYPTPCPHPTFSWIVHVVVTS